MLLEDLADELVGPVAAAQPSGRRVDEYQDAVLADEDAVRRPFHETSIGIRWSSCSLRELSDHLSED